MKSPKTQRPRHLSVTGAGCDVDESWGPLPSVRERAAALPRRTRTFAQDRVRWPFARGSLSRRCRFKPRVGPRWASTPVVTARPALDALPRLAAARALGACGLPRPPRKPGLTALLPSSFSARCRVWDASSAFPCSSLEVLQRTCPSVGSSAGPATPGGCPPSARVPALARAVLVVLPHLDGLTSRQPAGLLHPAADPGVHRVDEVRCGCSSLLAPRDALTLPSFAPPSQHPAGLADLLAPSPLRLHPLRAPLDLEALLRGDSGATTAPLARPCRLPLLAWASLNLKHRVHHRRHGRPRRRRLRRPSRCRAGISPGCAPRHAAAQLLSKPTQPDVLAPRSRGSLPSLVVVCSSALADRAPWHRCHTAACTASPEATPHVPTLPSTSLGQPACHRAGRLPAARANTQRLCSTPRSVDPAHPDLRSADRGSRPVSRPSQARPLHTAAFGAARLRSTRRIAATHQPCPSRVLGECRVVPYPTPAQPRRPLLPARRAVAVGRPLMPPRLRRLDRSPATRCRAPAERSRGLPPSKLPRKRPLSGSVELLNPRRTALPRRRVGARMLPALPVSRAAPLRYQGLHIASRAMSRCACRSCEAIPMRLRMDMGRRRHPHRCTKLSIDAALGTDRLTTSPRRKPSSLRGNHPSTLAPVLVPHSLPGPQHRRCPRCSAALARRSPHGVQRPSGAPSLLPLTPRHRGVCHVSRAAGIAADTLRQPLGRGSGAGLPHVAAAYPRSASDGSVAVSPTGSLRGPRCLSG